MIRITDEFVRKVAEFEGLRTRAYKCPGGVWTIGYGHTGGVKPGQRCTRRQAEAWLREDLAVAAREVEALGLDLAQGQAEALVDFVFNLGIGALKGSTLLKKIRAGAGTAEIQSEFRRWVYAGGEVQKGLVKRREWEAQRYAAGGGAPATTRGTERRKRTRARKR